MKPSTRWRALAALALSLTLCACDSASTPAPGPAATNNGEAANNGEAPDAATPAPDVAAPDVAQEDVEAAPDAAAPNNDAPLVWREEEITFGADALPGTFSAPEGRTGRPAVLLLHQLNATRAEWSGVEVIADLRAQGAVTLAVDLRGHGAGAPAGGKPWRDFSNADWAKLPQDAADALAWLRARPEVDPAKISIVGGSIGANTALLAFANDPQVYAGAFLSPGLPDYRGINIEGAMARAAGRPALIVGSRGDATRAQDAEQLAAQNDAAEAIVLDGGAHGARQLGQDPAARARVVRLLATGQP
jgi:dienelactone hydrolase